MHKIRLNFAEFSYFDGSKFFIFKHLSHRVFDFTVKRRLQRSEVLPVKLVEEVNRWEFVVLPISRVEEPAKAGEENELIARKKEKIMGPVLAPFQLAGPMKLWIQDSKHMRLSLPLQLCIVLEDLQLPHLHLLNHHFNTFQGKRSILWDLLMKIHILSIIVIIILINIIMQKSNMANQLQDHRSRLLLYHMVINLADARSQASVVEAYLEQRGVSLSEGYLSSEVIISNPKFRDQGMCAYVGKTLS